MSTLLPDNDQLLLKWLGDGFINQSEMLETFHLEDEDLPALGGLSFADETPLENDPLYFHLETSAYNDLPQQEFLPVAEDEDIEARDFLSMYMQENRHRPLLTAQEEIKLAQDIETGREAAQRLRTETLSSDERQTLIYLKEVSEMARERLVQANTRLVISVAKRYRGQGLDFLDLIQEGNLGLLIAVDKYEYRLGNRFSTYATWWIRQGVTRALTNYGRAIRIPAHLNTTVRQIYRMTQQFEQQYDRSPTTEELAECVNLPPEQIHWLQQITLPLLHLEQPAGDDYEAELGDFIEDVDTPRPLEQVAQNIFAEQIGEILGKLTPREAAVLRLRYGLQGYETHTLKEVGDLFGLSRERIRQLEMGALRKLRWHDHGHYTIIN